MTDFIPNLIVERESNLADARKLRNDLRKVVLPDPREIHREARYAAQSLAERVGVMEARHDFIRHFADLDTEQGVVAMVGGVPANLFEEPRQCGRRGENDDRVQSGRDAGGLPGRWPTCSIEAY